MFDNLEDRIEAWLWPVTLPATRVGRAALIPLRYLWALLREFSTGALSLRAMSLVFTTMLAIVPLLAFSFSVLKGLGLHRQLEPMLLRLLEPIGPRAGEITANIVGFVDNVSGSALASVSIGLLLFNVLSMAHKVESSFNYVWRVDRPRSLARRFSDYLSVMLIGPVIMSVAMGLLAAVSSNALMQRLTAVEPFGQWLTTLGELMPYVMVIAAFSFLYVFVPNTRVRLGPAIAGGALAGTLWAFGGGLFTSFVATATRTEIIYSGFAIVIVAMLWIYLSWLILLLGAQFAFHVQNPDYLRSGSQKEALTNAVREQLALSVMLLVGRDFSDPAHGWREESLAAQIGVPTHTLAAVTAALVDADLLTQAADKRLLPARDPRRISLHDMLAAVRGMPAAALERGSWGDVVAGISNSIAAAIDGATADRTLADIVDEEESLRQASANDTRQAVC